VLTKINPSKIQMTFQKRVLMRSSFSSLLQVSFMSCVLGSLGPLPPEFNKQDGIPMKVRKCHDFSSVEPSLGSMGCTAAGSQ
jgi:hypothetical protein